MEIKSQAQYDYIEKVSRGFPSKFTEKEAREFLIGVDRKLLPERIERKVKERNPLLELYKGEYGKVTYRRPRK